jgi:hypothetical protein
VGGSKYSSELRFTLVDLSARETRAAVVSEADQHRRDFRRQAL